MHSHTRLKQQNEVEHRISQKLMEIIHFTFLTTEKMWFEIKKKEHGIGVWHQGKLTGLIKTSLWKLIAFEHMC